MLLVGIPFMHAGICLRTAQAKEPELIAEAPAPLVLNGRLEQITGRDAQLPISKTLTGLKAGVGKVDASVVSPRTQNVPGGIDSYPRDWNGNWGGRFAISWSKYDSRVPDSGRQLATGDHGLAIFSFGVEKGTTMLKPAKIWFAPAKAQSLKDVQVPLNDALRASELVRSNPDTKVEVALMELGDTETANVSKETVRREVLKNTLYRLQPNVIEQNIVTKLNRLDGVTGKSRTSYIETVVRLTTYKPGLLWTQIGYVQYNQERDPVSQFIVQGWITRNWQAAARGIEELTRNTLAGLGYTDISLPAAPETVTTNARTSPARVATPARAGNAAQQGRR